MWGGMTVTLAPESRMASMTSHSSPPLLWSGRSDCLGFSVNADSIVGPLGPTVVTQQPVAHPVVTQQPVARPVVTQQPVVHGPLPRNVASDVFLARLQSRLVVAKGGPSQLCVVCAPCDLVVVVVVVGLPGGSSSG